MRMKGIRSLREMTRLLDVDTRLRKLCLVKEDEKGYPRSVLSRFIRKVGEDNLTRIIEEKVVKLLIDRSNCRRKSGNHFRIVRPQANLATREIRVMDITFDRGISGDELIRLIFEKIEPMHRL
jgi:hypothetical protein